MSARRSPVSMRSQARSLGLVLALLLAAPAALAQDGARQRQGSALPCTCRAEGQTFDLGATICMQTPRGPRLAVCDMVLNNTSWRTTETLCPQAGLPTRPAG